MSNGKIVLITGIAGFIGSHIADEFIRQNYYVVGVDNLKNGSMANVNPKVDFYNMDINHIHAIDAILKKYHPHYLIHHASNLVDVSLSIRYPWRAHNDTLITTKLIEKAKRNSIRHILFASSANVYGNQAIIPIHEKTTTKPLSPYGLAKVAIEDYLTYVSNAYAIPCCIFRYFNVYGPRQSLRNKPAIPTFINKLMNNQVIAVKGGQQTRDFVYVREVASVNLLACRKEANGIFNIGSGMQIKIADVVKLLEQLLNKQAKIKIYSKDISDYDYSQASIEKAKTVLGWEPTVSFKEGLRQTIEYYEKDLHRHPII